jgi:hypothetical protein
MSVVVEVRRSLILNIAEAAVLGGCDSLVSEPPEEGRAH